MCVLVFKSKCNGIKPFENLNLIEADIFTLRTFTLILGFIATSFGRKLILLIVIGATEKCCDLQLLHYRAIST